MFDAHPPAAGSKALWGDGPPIPRSLAAARKIMCARRSRSSICFVISENVLANDTVNAGAHILLPRRRVGARRDGTVTNSERRILAPAAIFCRQRGEAQPDWWIVTQVARPDGICRGVCIRLCGRNFSRGTRRCRLSRTAGRRDFSISARSPAIGDDAFDALDPRAMAATRPAETVQHKDRRFFMRGGFYTADRKGALHIAVEPPAPKVCDQARNFRFALNTGRLRDQWHTMDAVWAERATSAAPHAGAVRRGASRRRPRR